jgi:hypothetical protein
MRRRRVVIVSERALIDATIVRCVGTGEAGEE